MMGAEVVVAMSSSRIENAERQKKNAPDRSVEGVVIVARGVAC